MLINRAKTVLAGVLGVSLLAIAMIALLQERSDASRRAQANLGQVGAKLNELTTAPVGVMFGAPAPLVRLRMAQLKYQIQSTVRSLRTEMPVAALDDVDRALRRSFAAGEATMALMSRMSTQEGRVAIAGALAGNDPERLGGRAGAYRMGGDEFCVLARLDGDDAVSIARVGAEALSDSGEAFSIGCSYGIALAPVDATAAEEVLRIADQRMYEQKAAGSTVDFAADCGNALRRPLRGGAVAG